MLTSEAEVVRTLRRGTYTMGTVYEIVEASTDISRDGGRDPVPGHPGDERWQRRVRGAIQQQRKKGKAQRVGYARWAIEGTPEAPARMLLVVAGATPLEFELRLQEAIDLLRTLESPADLVLCDPPWALRRGQGRFADGHGYQRDNSKVVGGYVDIDPGQYPAWTRKWVAAAAGALRLGGQLVVVTGPQRAAIVQVAAEEAGLTWVSSVAAKKDFPLPSRSRPTPSHWTVTVMCKGSLKHPGRVFNPPEDQPGPFPQDWWPVNGRADRRGNLLRYDNALPLKLVSRIVRAFSNPGGHVVEPCLGSGAGALACLLNGRRYTGSDVNVRAVRFAAARLLDEHLWAEETQPGLLSRAEVMAPEVLF